MNIFRCLPAAALAVAACHPAARGDPAAAPLAGARIGGPFALVDQDGRAVTDRDYAGRYRIMYFGYTFCPDVCPTDAQTLAAAVKQVERESPDLGRRIVPIFVSIDPARDTPAVLKRFVRAFHPRMVGLTGSPAAVAQAARAYAVFYDKGAATPGGGYMMSHSAQAYLMDPAGKPLALLPQDKGAAAVAAEIERWAR